MRLSLAELAKLPLEERAALVQREGGKEIRRALEEARQDGLAGADDLPCRLAWALAFNVGSADPSGAGGAGGNPARARDKFRARSYSTVAGLGQEASLAELYHRLTLPLQGGTTGLAELAWSVACEQCDDWQPADCRPLDAEGAKHHLELEIRRDSARVMGYVRHRWGVTGIDPLVVAAEAWSQVFLSYWSTQARTRFLGLSRISTLVCTFARFQARSHDPPAVPEVVKFPSELVRVTPHDELVRREHDERFARAFEDCAGELPPRQELIVRLRWQQELTPAEIADRLRCSRPNVSQVLGRGTEALLKCLAAKGFEVQTGTPVPRGEVKSS
ncbi:MAG: sigma-70 family RNA polymerase sigma factor [Planctomycetota bacterium]